MANDKEIQHIVERLRNSNRNAEGTSLPGRQTGSLRVPIVKGLKVARTDTQSNGTRFILVWNDPEDSLPISHFNVYVEGLFENNQPYGPFSIKRSPAYILAPSFSADNVTLRVQTVMANGQVSNMEISPTVSGVTNPNGPLALSKLNINQVFIENLTLTNNSPAAGRVAWSACTLYHNGTTYVITASNTPNTTDTFITWTVGATTFSAASSYSPSTTVFLIATNTGGTGDTAWNKVGASGIATGSINDLAITTAKVNDLAVTTGKINDLAVTTAKINDLAVTTAKINDLAVTTAKINDLAVTNAKINDLNASKITAGTLDAARIAAASIDATKINIKQIIVTSLTLTNNSPGAGRIAWSACTVYYNGTAYSISSGSTASSSELFVTWVAAAGSFTASTTYTPVVGTFLIATNNSGTADEAWNKTPEILGSTQLRSGAIYGSNLQMNLVSNSTPPFAAIEVNSLHSHSIYMDTVTTTDATATNIGPAFAVTSSSSLALEVTIIGRRTSGGGSTNDSARYSLSAVYHNPGATALVGAITKVADENVAGWDGNLVLSGDDVRVQVTGAAATTIRWGMTARAYLV